MNGEGSVLVVDDDLVNRRLLERSLRSAGLHVRVAGDGEAALAELRKEPADVVLLDIVMPRLDGIETLRRIKSDASLRDVPVIMISAVDDDEDVVRCIELGAEDYLPKPFDPVLLRARINSGLNKRRLQELERARVREVFARFLPTSLVEEMLAQTDGSVRLGGVRRVGTAVFTDIRSFTTFAESTAPDRVVDVLNRYFTEMNGAILDHGGTLVSYLGDGMLAVFGAPLEQEDHARAAFAAAREMLSERLPRFNAWLREQGLAEFRIGIGVSSGPFMAGNVGSERRVEYTAIGDTVNTACRIEAHTKVAGLPLLVADETRALLDGDAAELVYVEELTLRGRATPTRIWGLAA